MTSMVAPLQYYSEESTAKMVGISRARLRAWCRAGLVASAQGTLDRCGYSFQDLVALRSAKQMIERGVSLGSIRMGIERLRKDAPGELPTHCLARHRVVANSGHWSVRREGMTEDVHSGQLSFNYSGPGKSIQTVGGDVLSFPGARRSVGVSNGGPSEPEDRSCPDAWFEFGSDCELLWDRESPTDRYFRRAQQAYLKAIELDESHARAWTNLATLHATVGDVRVAREYYQLATQCDGFMVEPLCNLGELDLRDGKFQDAADRFGSILVIEPENLDGLYGLARAMIALGEHEWGADVLRTYCGCLSRLDPELIDDELEQRWEGARLVISTHEAGHTRQTGSERPGLEHA